MMSFEFLMHFIDLFFLQKENSEKHRSFIYSWPRQTLPYCIHTNWSILLNAAANTFTHDKNILFLLILTIIDIKTYLQCFSTQQQFVYGICVCTIHMYIYTQTADTYMHMCLPVERITRVLTIYTWNQDLLHSITVTSCYSSYKVKLADMGQV